MTRRWGPGAAMIGRVLAVCVPAVFGATLAVSDHAVAQRATEASTAHRIERAQGALGFRAVVSRIAIKDDKGRADAEAGVIAFLRQSGDVATRAVTFIVGGGPGTSTSYLNLGALGPWRIDFDGAPSTPRALAPNADTWLDLTDLVFVDPPGIGHGRLTSKSKETQERLWSVKGDIDALADVVAHWLHANNRIAAPKFLLGQSYGGFRVPRLAEALHVRHGVAMSGFILISPVLDYGWRYHARTSPLSFASLLPSFAAVRLEREGRLSPEALTEAERYARGDFIIDFMRGSADREAVQRMVARVTALTGLSVEIVRAARGRIDEHVYEREAARASGRVTSSYDATASSADPDPTRPRPDFGDPFLAALKAPLNTAMTQLLRTQLGSGASGPYNVANETAFEEWKWDEQHGLPEAVAALRKMLALDPKLRVLVAHGYADLQSPYFETTLILDQLPQFGGEERIRRRNYPGGHMFYSRDASRAAFRADAEAFYRSIAVAR